MDGKALEAMNRMSQNMPVKRLHRTRQTTALGELYMALGRGPGDNGKDCWHAMYVLDPVEGFGEVAKCGIEFYGELTHKTARQNLFDMAWNDTCIMRGTEQISPGLLDG